MAPKLEIRKFKAGFIHDIRLLRTGNAVAADFARRGHFGHYFDRRRDAHSTGQAVVTEYHAEEQEFIRIFPPRSSAVNRRAVFGLSARLAYS
jgi:plasmid stabilization system protein ParE